MLFGFNGSRDVARQSSLVAIVSALGVVLFIGPVFGGDQSNPTTSSTEKEATDVGGNIPNSSFMKEQLLSFRMKLEESEGRLLSFKQQHGLVSLDEQRRLLLQQRRDLDTTLKSANNKTKGLASKLTWLRKQLDVIPERIPFEDIREGRLVDRLNATLLDLRLKERELLTKYQKSSPLIISVRKEIELLQGQLEGKSPTDKVVTTVKNPLYREVELQLLGTEAELISVEAQSDVIQQQISEVDKELNRLDSLGTEYRDLVREVTADERNFVAYLRKVGTTPTQDYQIEVGDELDLKFFFNQELNEKVSVRPDGRIALQLIGDIQVAGRTVEQVRELLVQKYSTQLTNPEIAVILRSFSLPVEEILNTTSREGNRR